MDITKFDEMLAFAETMKPLDTTPDQDLKKLFPDASIEDTYRVQFALMTKRAEAGDKIVGYKASAVRGAAAKQRPGVPVPTIGTLLDRKRGTAQTGTAGAPDPGDDAG